MKKQLRRKMPPPGTLICISLPKGGYAYAVCVRPWNIWIYNFITSRPAFHYFLRDLNRWFQYISCDDGAVGAETFDIGRLPLSEEECRVPKTFRRIPEEAMRRNPAPPTPYVAHDFYASHCSVADSYITEAELPDYQESFYFTPKQLLDYLEKNRHRLERVEALPSQIVVPKLSAEVETFFPQSVFEIWLSELEKMAVTDLQGIAEEIDIELEKHNGGEVISTGGVQGEDQHNIAVENAPGKRKEALACIRRVLLRLKADPDNTDIWEQKADDEEKIEHPLIAPPKGK